MFGLYCYDMNFLVCSCFFRDLLEKYRKTQEVRAQKSSQRLFQTISQNVNEKTSEERHGCMSDDVYADCDCDITNKQM